MCKCTPEVRTPFCGKVGCDDWNDKRRGQNNQGDDMFDTHKLNEQGFEQVKQFKTGLSEAVTKAIDLLPEGREKAVFKTKIEEAVFFGTKAIASKEGNFTEIVKY